MEEVKHVCRFEKQETIIFGVLKHFFMLLYIIQKRLFQNQFSNRLGPVHIV